MSNQHFSAKSVAAVCRSLARRTIYGNPTLIALPACRNAGLSAMVCVVLAYPAPLSAQQNTDLAPSTEEEILDQIIEEQKGYDTNAAARNKQFCQIILVNDGMLHEIPGMFRLSSKGAGGRAGVAQITTSNGSYRASIDTPLGFTFAPLGGNNGVTMQASFSANGATNFSETPGNIEQKLKRGLTTIETHLDVTRNGSPFPAGNYSAELTLRCE